MTVWVDDGFVEGDWGRWTGGGHLQADSTEELHAFADRLGLRRAWFQSKPGRPWHDHYDLHRQGRDRAIALGAVPRPWREAARRNIAARRAARGATGAAGERGPDASGDRAATRAAASGDAASSRGRRAAAARPVSG